ncbi:uncharacterized protein L3040_000323 [Drepanopeziza brunnea f. sp. 'multigermtubi']|uniref:Uncharacterized protein n=1 Tax=Marssonina brunnea f. sp. multigermtubi (strain MB_m1) TaxID=1072389 RepID=K1XIE8_MARBU|nr:uncharacterized protein MBM_09530 [Drepanopeziza brunnea f. sp. 'multigermtubi' MB_m1]EKD12209.1 hypothetical protein MBM_09530 [Drepanopeziza brunnea f. sp. 'multigermtubi' MB_m1]KAJ5054038.1 hypothetical protein L3040_000323 [Drepanopeziza brunnea f. sp. 'multigermtubi']
MGDFKPLIGPGLDVANSLIDKHFDKLPNSAFRRETYSPRNIHLPYHHRRGRKSRKDSKDTHQSDYDYDYDYDHDSDSDFETQNDRRARERRYTQSTPRSEAGSDNDSYYSRPPTELSETNLVNHDRSMTRIPPNYGDSRITRPTYPPVYSHQPPRQRPEYIPSPPPSANTYYVPPPTNHMAMNRGRDVDPHRDDDYYSESYHAPRRPRAVTRRSSSYHGPRSKDDYGYGKQVSRRKGSSSEAIDRVKDAADRYNLKDDINNLFTASPEGLVGGAAGAALGGWAAQKAQIGYSKGKRHEPSPLLTLIGATVGGLAVNSLVDRYQDGKKDAAKKEKRGEQRYGSEDGSDDDRSHRSSHRSQRSYHRRRRDSYD